MATSLGSLFFEWFTLPVSPFIFISIRVVYEIISDLVVDFSRTTDTVMEMADQCKSWS